MRLWTLHPKYLDGKGLVALWRESLLAQEALAGRKLGYRNHPQLERFKENHNTLGYYLAGVLEEGWSRGYKFKMELIREPIVPSRERIEIGNQQLFFEWKHLLRKLNKRSQEKIKTLTDVLEKRPIELYIPEPHPLFKIVTGGIESWEKDTNARSVVKSSLT